MHDWREATCERCQFRINDECRHSPMSRDIYGGYSYPPASERTPACAQYRPAVDLSVKPAMMECPSCDGKGIYTSVDMNRGKGYEIECLACNGKGEVPRPTGMA